MKPLLSILALVLVAACLAMTPLASSAAGGPGPVDGSFEANGFKIHYIVAGHGEPVVLIHGLSSSAWINWQVTGVVALLAGKYQVIAIDLPGHGRSDKPEIERVYGAQMAEDVKRLLDHLNIPKAHIVGYSLGGMIAVKFLSKHEDRALSAVIGGMGWLREGSGLQKIWDRVPLAKQSRRPGVSTPAACLRSIGELAVTADDLRRINIPVEVLVGSDDPVRMLYVAPLKTVRSDWQVIEIRSAGHLNCIFKPEFRKEIKQWLDQHSQSNRSEVS